MAEAKVASKVAIIPARGGSKRIPRKNIKRFCGRPMIEWSILAARTSGIFDQVIVSTDDTEIARVATEAGAKAPFVRPKELSGDHIATRPVVNHAIGQIKGIYGQPELVCCIYPTAPFLQPADLKRGLALLEGSPKLNFAFTAASFPYPIQRAFKLSKSGEAVILQPEHQETRSQDLEEAYHDAGQFYWGRSDAFLSNKSIFTGGAAPVILPRYRVCDIDTEEDWQEAEFLFAALQRRKPELLYEENP